MCYSATLTDSESHQIDAWHASLPRVPLYMPMTADMFDRLLAAALAMTTTVVAVAVAVLVQLMTGV